MPQVVNAAETRKTYFGEKAARYDEGRETCPKWRAEHAAVGDFLEWLPKKSTVLDIPVGTGRFLALYRELGLDCIGMDVSKDMMAQARAKDERADIRFGDALDIPLEDRSVDAAVCIRLLTLIDTPDMIAVMRELGRVVRREAIVSLKTARDRQVSRRSITHPEQVFFKTVLDAGFRIDDFRVARAPDYRVFRLAR